MRKLGFSEIFIKFIKKLYQNTLSIIFNNGFLSTPFSLSRGVRQGCPLSLLLYIINGEVINLNIKNNDKIVGYPIPNQKENAKLSQYANDTNLLAPTEQSIIEILTQQTFVGLQDVLKMSSRHVLKASSTRLQRNNFTSSKTS